ncbi:DUF4279 domain-containing protein [Paraburkholderia panacisoli]|uniref:DUF4279 domain-containing protein n=1 Tax=Paraburkholderia panacisoli TaxID=2603818 RepID=A0A5B0H8B7_9BURK|nr:DUF4279 domain-containing protein [Paraburkholderia panacisoli]KAA1011284.1 DUF4279 domain-containing protein [Paraburkholderia panacisoli]
MNAHQLAHASFSIYQDAEPPEFWTAYFDVQPDIAIIKGKPFVTPSGRLSSGLGRIGVWGIKSKQHVQSDLPEPHLRYLIERLALPRADLPELLRRTNARMCFFCYWDNENGDRMPDVADDIRQMMESMGGTIEIDEYR